MYKISSLFSVKKGEVECEGGNYVGSGYLL